MKDQDLFNVIDNIDDRFISHAGKYLLDDNNIFSVSPNGEPIEAGKSKKQAFSLKLIVPVAAAAAIMVAVSVSLRFFGGNNVLDPQDGYKRSTVYTEVNSGLAYSSTVEGTGYESTGETPPINESVTGEYSFPFYGPDNLQISREDVIVIETGSVKCGFAYIGMQSSVNQNQIDHPDFSLEDQKTPKKYRRIRAGEMYGGFTVTEAYSVFRLDENNSNGYVLDTCVLKMSGLVNVPAYLVREDNGKIRCYVRNGKFPAMNYIGRDDGDYEFGNYHTDTTGGFRYIGELPGFEVQLLHGDRQRLEQLLGNTDLCEISLSLSSVLITNTKGECTVTAECENVFPRVWYDPNEGQSIMTILDWVDTYEQLAEIISEYETKFAGFGVYSEAVKLDPMKFGAEITGGELAPGMIIALYDADGELYGAYTYRFNALSE